MKKTPAQAGQLFCQFVRSMAAGKGDVMVAEGFAKAKDWFQVATICKALVTPTTTGQIPDAMLPIAYEIAELLRPRTVVGRLQGLRRAPFFTRLLRQTAGATGRWVAEGKPIPASTVGLSQNTILQPLNIGAIIVVSDEVVKTDLDGSDEFLIEESLAALVEAIDSVFLDPANNGIAGQLPASISSGATELNSAGPSLAQIDSDIQRMLQALIAAQMPLTTAAWIMSPVTAVYLNLLRGSGGAPAYPNITATGGTLAGLPVLTSAAVTASGSPGERYIALVEAGEIVFADDNEATVDIARHAAIQLNDAPSEAAAPLTSLWQNNLVGLKATRHINWQRRRDGAVATLRNVTY